MWAAQTLFNGVLQACLCVLAAQISLKLRRYVVCFFHIISFFKDILNSALEQEEYLRETVESLQKVATSSFVAINGRFFFQLETFQTFHFRNWNS